MHLDVVHQTLQNVLAPIASPDLRGLLHNPPVQNGEMGLSMQYRSRGKGCGRVNIPFRIMSCHPQCSRA